MYIYNVYENESPFQLSIFFSPKNVEYEVITNNNFCNLRKLHFNRYIHFSFRNKLGILTGRSCYDILCIEHIHSFALMWFWRERGNKRVFFLLGKLFIFHLYNRMYLLWYFLEVPIVIREIDMHTLFGTEKGGKKQLISYNI